MKKELFVGSMILFLLFAPLSKAAFAEAETKRVCVKDNGKETCKTIKVHKKAEKVTDGAPTDPVKKEDKKKK
jgi:hypothetical protein